MPNVCKGKVSKRQMRKKKAARKRNEPDDQDLLLHAREVIPFGETSDAPPSFSAALRKKLEPLQAQAGGKDLLLKKLVRQDEGGAKGQSTSSKAGKNKSKQVVDEAERLAVIEAYRKLKNAKSK